MVPFSGKDHIVVRSELLSCLGPSIKVVLRSDGSSNALLCPYRPELLEGGGAIDTGLVGPGGLVDIVGSTIGRDLALLGCPAAGVVRAIALNDVVLNERVARPAVQAHV